MAANNTISFDNAVISLEEDSRLLLAELHSLATAAGYLPIISVVGKKVDNYKIEYKKTKSAGSLYIVRIDGKKLSLRCKLFHLDEYPGLLDELSEPVRNGLLSSKSCVNDGGCKGPVAVISGGKEYSLCRHSMQFKSVTSADVQNIWGLLEAESRYQK